MGTEEKLLTDVEAAMEKKKEARKNSKRTVEMVDLPSHDTIQVYMWVAVAYENGWFPGIIQSKEGMFEINFMEPGLKLGISK